MLRLIEYIFKCGAHYLFVYSKEPAHIPFVFPTSDLKNRRVMCWLFESTSKYGARNHFAFRQSIGF